MNALAKPSWWRNRLLQLHGWLVLAWFYLPIAVVVAFSFNRSRLAVNWEGFTFDWYLQLVQDRQLWRAAHNSLIIAGCSCLLSTLLGTLAAFGLTRGRFRGRSLVEGLLYIPIILPDIVTGISLLLLFSQVGMRLGYATAIIAHVTFCSSFVFVVVRARLQGMDPTLEQAASDLGATPWQTFRWVTLPQVAPGILAGALMAFTLSFDDVIVSFFTTGPGASTLPLYVFSQLRLGVNPKVNALSTVLLAVTLALLALFWLLSRQTSRSALPRPHQPPD